MRVMSATLSGWMATDVTRANIRVLLYPQCRVLGDDTERHHRHSSPVGTRSICHFMPRHSGHNWHRLPAHAAEPGDVRGRMLSVRRKKSHSRRLFTTIRATLLGIFARSCTFRGLRSIGMSRQKDGNDPQRWRLVVALD